MPPLTPIAAVVDHFDIPLSTLHYWERRGLITAHRRSGRRCYDQDQLYRIALIKQWQSTGLMTLDEITTLLTARPGQNDWRATVTTHIATIDTRMRALESARHYLHWLLTCPHTTHLDHCPNYRASVTLPEDDA
ncbi:DNA-binding transcriptional MerR regulator [Nocardia tenerifensis]|uniref:DNA-binding transcriptional MerR regulator n=1 Tax=Nocardia tenerifensis TaxID=228006 RepID=A0A318JRP4_9NOCA|nr:MerR family transcriptional regulator [Nocardia tenerifensis]PXX57626.1 DNA-binding transcriptional MerR regulator [Nocardia tenerifensis]